MLQAQVRDELELVAAEDLAGRVVRRVDDDRPGPRRHGGPQLIGIDCPVRFVERHVSRGSPGEDRVGAVILVERLEHDDLVARVEQAEHRRDHPLGRAAHHRDLGIRVRLPARVEAGGLGGDGPPERRRAGDDRVLVDVGEERGRGRLLELDRGREVRKALGQADGAGLDRQAVHLPDDGLGEALGLSADAAHGKLLCQAAAASDTRVAARAASSWRIRRKTSSLIRRRKARMASVLVSPWARRCSRYVLPGPSRWSWVIAIRWRATLSWRLPVRLRRWRSVLPDQTGSGAEPLWRAKAALERKRPTPGGLADELGRRQWATADEGQERRGELRDQTRDLALEVVDRRGQRRGSGQRARGRSDRRSRVPRRDRARGRPGRRPGRGRGRPARRQGRARGGASAGGSGPESARRRGPRDGRPAGGPPDRGHRALPPAGPRARPPGRRPGRRSDRSCRVRGSSGGLRPSAWAGPGRRPRRRRSRSVDRRRERWRQSSRAHERSGNRPAQRTSSRWPALVVRDGLLGELAAGPVRRDGGVCALVRIDADDDHVLRCLLIRGDAPDRPVDTPEWGRLPRSYEVTPVGPIHVRRPAVPMEATPARVGIESMSQAAGLRQPDTHGSLAKPARPASPITVGHRILTNTHARLPSMQFGHVAVLVRAKTMSRGNQ